ncbi:MAG: class I SAM-dependent methyltransferase [Myxococcales bacterium]|nr:class I SAM-dependent methyltransferase [Myxococcales bacterium]
MDESLDRVTTTLDRLADIGFLWHEGLLNRGGPHRRLKGFHYPISIGEDECRVFGKLIEALKPEHCYIVGNAFGFSSAYIADVMKRHGGQSVVTLDNQSEGAGQVAAKIADQLTQELGLAEILRNKKGSSPQDIPSTTEREHYDLIFIDGLHRHPQVTHDLEALLPYCGPKTIVVFHDSWIIGVPEAVDRAKQEGFRCLWVPTSCEMIFATRDPELWQRLCNIFPDGIEDRGKRNYLYGWTLYARETVTYHLKRMLGRE